MVTLGYFAKMMQLSLVLIIAMLFHIASRVVKTNDKTIKELRWIAYGFFLNLICIAAAILVDNEKLVELLWFDKVLIQKINLFIGTVVSFLFLTGSVNWYNNHNLSITEKLSIGTNIKLNFLNFRTTILLNLLFFITILSYITIIKNLDVDSRSVRFVTALYSILSLICIIFFFRYATSYKKARGLLITGFAIWTLLQGLSLQQGYYQNYQVTFIGYGGSLLAKALILFGLFTWYVNDTTRAAILYDKTVEAKNEFESSANYFSDILRDTFHEIYIPLQSLGLSINAIKSSLQTDTSRSLLEAIETNFERVKAIIKYSKSSYTKDGEYIDHFIVDTSLPDERAKIVSINHLLEITLRSLKKIYVDVKFNSVFGSNCGVKCKQTEILQVFSNIVKNGIESYDKKEKKTINLKSFIERKEFAENQKSSLVVVHIDDMGCGIPQSEIGKIWLTGYTTKKKDIINVVRGNGLNVVKKIIDRNKDISIDVESPYVSGKEIIQGTRFIIKFPHMSLEK